jgi:hypothetical protein
LSFSESNISAKFVIVPLAHSRIFKVKINSLFCPTGTIEIVCFALFSKTVQPFQETISICSGI